MATLKEKLDEMARIKAELQRMEDAEDTTEENDGDLRDTLVERWQQLDGECKPIIERMEKVRAITRTAQDPANLERPDGGNPYNGGNPDLVLRNNRNPYGELEAVRSHLVQSQDLRSLALGAIELEAKRGSFISDDYGTADDHAEVATRMVESYPAKSKTGRELAEHILETGSPEYQETFQAYLDNPQREAARAALSLTLANGGYLLPFVLDQLAVA